MEEHIRQAVEALTMNVRRDLDAHLEQFTTGLLRRAEETHASSRADLDRAVTDVRAEAERAFSAKLDALRTELTQEMELRLEADRAELEAANAEHLATQRQGRMDALGRLLAAARRIDDASTLSGILEALAKGAAAETSRVAILIVEAEHLKTWGHFGFAPEASPTDLPIRQAAVLAEAVAGRKTSTVASSGMDAQAGAPPFMRLPAGHAALVAPIVVADEVVGLLYADDAERPSSPGNAPEWTDEVELLVRHAAARLERVTSERAVDVLTR